MKGIRHFSHDDAIPARQFPLFDGWARNGPVGWVNLSKPKVLRSIACGKLIYQKGSSFVRQFLKISYSRL